MGWTSPRQWTISSIELYKNLEYEQRNILHENEVNKILQVNYIIRFINYYLSQTCNTI